MAQLAEALTMCDHEEYFHNILCFGNRPAAVFGTETPPATDLAPDESGVTLSEGGDVGFDESGYDGHEPPSDDVNQPVQDQRIFLPLTQR